jgi:uncharacterized protein
MPTDATSSSPAHRPLRALAIAGALALGAFSSAPASAASYSCMPDTLNAAERRVCDSPRLSALDERLDHWYRRALVRAGYFDQTAEVRAAQRNWIARRNACGANSWCLWRVYARRVNQLRNYVEHV